jgi:hypothetical protein
MGSMRAKLKRFIVYKIHFTLTENYNLKALFTSKQSTPYIYPLRFPRITQASYPLLCNCHHSKLNIRNILAKNAIQRKLTKYFVFLNSSFLSLTV